MPHRGRSLFAHGHPAARWLALAWAMLLTLGFGLFACEDRLPAFADPPPYDAGSEPDAASSEDGG